MPTKTGTRKKASRTKPKVSPKKPGGRKRRPTPSAPETMIERAKRETSLFMGRKKTHQLRKPFDGIRPETVCTAIYAQYGIASTIAQALGVHYCTFNNWKNQHQWIKDALQEAREQMLDVAENSLLKSVEKQEGWATCFLLKCRGKQRGYVEKLILGGSLDSTLTVNLGGSDDDQGTDDRLASVN